VRLDAAAYADPPAVLRETEGPGNA